MRGPNFVSYPPQTPVRTPKKVRYCLVIWKVCVALLSGSIVAFQMSFAPFADYFYAKVEEVVRGLCFSSLSDTC